MADGRTDVETHHVVYQQLQDLVLIQQQQIESFGEMVRSNSVPLVLVLVDAGDVDRRRYAACGGCSALPSHLLPPEIRNREEESVRAKIYDDIVKELEKERLEHAKTKALLSKESEKLQFALGEVEILTKQLEREKKAFENALESIKNKAVKELNKNDKLKSKCNDIESKIEKQEDILSSKEDQIKELCHQLAKQKAMLKQQVNDFEIQQQQNAYIERVLERKKRKPCGKFHTSK